VCQSVIAKVKPDQVSDADLAARHAGAAVDASRGVLLTKPLTGILKGRLNLNLEARDGLTCGGMAISKESTQ
jgi:hypothetical protein